MLTILELFIFFPPPNVECEKLNFALFQSSAPRSIHVNKFLILLRSGGSLKELAGVCARSACPLPLATRWICSALLLESSLNLIRVDETGRWVLGSSGAQLKHS